jgi:hypothetical protein
MYHSLNVATVALVAVVSIALYTIVVSNQVFVVVGLVEVEVEVEVVVVTVFPSFVVLQTYFLPSF